MTSCSPVPTHQSFLRKLQSVSWEIPSQQLKHLKLVQNTAARTVTCTRKRENITPFFNGYGAGILAGTLPQYAPARTLHSSSQPHLWIPSAGENTPKTVWFLSLFQLCSQALECPTTNNQRSRFLGYILQTSENAPVLQMALHPVSSSF